MKRIVIMAVMLITMLCASVCSADSWSDVQHNIGEDKFAHFGVSYIICDQLHCNCGMNKFWSAVTTLAIGAAKEKFIDDHWDSSDMLANTAGVLVYQVTW